MREITTDPSHPGLRKTDHTGMNVVYLVLSEEERAKGFVRPLRVAYIHKKCGSITTMASALCETYARDPQFYGATFCVHCRKHYPVFEFTWATDGTEVGS